MIKTILIHCFYNPITMQVKDLSNIHTTIKLENMSPKQLLCECIDLATMMFKEVIDHYVAHNNFNSPFNKQKIDLSQLCGYMMDPDRTDKLLTHFIGDDKGAKALAKTWVHEIRGLRNVWAHSESITYRLVNRGFDTLSLLFQSFKGDQSSPLFQKIEFYRKGMLIATAKNYAGL